MRIQSIIYALLNSGAWKATKYVSEKSVITATRRLYRKKLPRKGSNIEIMLKIGRPNYAERQFIKACNKAGEKFPVRKLQLRFPPKSK